MTPVSIASINCVEPGSNWQASLGDLIVEAAAPILDSPVDALFCATGAASLVQRQMHSGALAADRLGLRCPAHSVDAGDISGAAALLAAWQFVRCGLGGSALVVGAAKLADLSDAKRFSVLDSLLDQECNAAAGRPSFTAQSGLLASAAIDAGAVASGALVDTAAANQVAWARHSGGRAPSARELAEDLVASPPLVRADFAALTDGAAALLLVAGDTDGAIAAIEGGASTTDIVDPWSRRDPLAFDAAMTAVRDGWPAPTPPKWIEIDAANSLAHLLALRAARRNWQSGDEGCGVEQVNAAGGGFGRGRPFGASALYQVADITGCEGPDAALLLAVNGLGAAAVAISLRRGRR